jgi:hypothetical protein
MIEGFHLRNECTESHIGGFSWNEPHNSNLLLLNHLLDECIHHLGAISDSLIIRINKVGASIVVIGFESILRLESHESEGWFTKALNLLHLLLCEGHSLLSKWNEGSYLLLI